MLNQPLPEDSRAQLSAARLAALVESYNLARGWAAEGWPRPDASIAET
jgi:hypothetical protein